jgi:threonine dehydratase
LSLSLADVLAARRAIAGIAVRTPLVPSPHMSRLAGHEVLYKLETTQPVGAFKLRGAVNAVAALPPGTAGVTCCSTGNHGRALAFAARAKGLRAVVCMSSLSPKPRSMAYVHLAPRSASSGAARTKPRSRAAGWRSRRA